MFKRLGWVLCLLSLWSGPGQAGQWIDEPVALAWTAEEVERASAGQLLALAQRAEREDLQGCQAHCQRLQRIFSRLVEAARTQGGRAKSLPWSLTVLRLSDVEAMALPGGQVVVSEAFVDQRGLDDEALAFVLAHEMAHSILEHERQALSFARLLLPRNVKRTVRDMYTEMDYNFALLKAMEPVLHQGEFEADEVGLLLASAAGFDPVLQLAFIESEARVQGLPSPLVSTHPTAPARLDKLVERVPLAQRLHNEQLP